jgi:hypothetical protein
MRGRLFVCVQFTTSNVFNFAEPGLGRTADFLPGSATPDRRSANPTLQRTAITGRLGAGGVYVAYGSGYPSRTGVVLGRVGGGSLTVGRGTSIDNVDVAPAQEGRLWVMWSDGSKLYAVRTNRAVTRVGPRVAVNRPPGSVSVSVRSARARSGRST